jgi:hypothetical protein
LSKSKLELKKAGLSEKTFLQYLFTIGTYVRVVQLENPLERGGQIRFGSDFVKIRRQLARRRRDSSVFSRIAKANAYDANGREEQKGWLLSSLPLVTSSLVK